MKLKSFIIFTLTASLLMACNSSGSKEEIRSSPLSENIRINQLGYYPELAKSFTLADHSATDFQLVSKEGKIVFRGKLSEQRLWEPSGELLSSGDFSSFSREGSYFIHIPGLGNSHSFEISKNLYSAASVAALRTFFFQRTAMEMEEKYLGSYARPLGHPDDTCYYHPSSGRSEGFRSSSKGWYDAGDYGKYVVNASIATGQMLNLYELYPDLFSDGTLNIPESGNNINDLLDEIKYELDWVLTMQDDDGGVFHKMTSLHHDGITMPHETFSKRFIIGKGTAASLDFAAMLAQASRIYKDIDPEFGKTCLDKARKAYAWALANPDLYYSNPKGIGTGAYNDKILDEEFFWAAAELYCTTGEDEYYKAIKPKLGGISFRLEESWRNYLDNIGYYSLIATGVLNDEDQSVLEEGLLKLADKLQLQAEQNAYDMPISRFVWGSNSDVLNTAIIQLYAHYVSGDKKYLDAGAQFTDYVFGKNATSYSFVSGFGTKTSNNFHHRLFMADDNEDAFPGFIAGGPNFQRQDAYNLEQNGATYPDTIAAKSYIDHAGSYASNEICLNWNAPLVFVLGYIDGQADAK